MNQEELQNRVQHAFIAVHLHQEAWSVGGGVKSQWYPGGPKNMSLDFLRMFIPPKMVGLDPSSNSRTTPKFSATPEFYPSKIHQPHLLLPRILDFQPYFLSITRCFQPRHALQRCRHFHSAAARSISAGLPGLDCRPAAGGIRCGARRVLRSSKAPR